MLTTILVTAVVTALITHFTPKVWFYYKVTRNRPSPLGYVEAVDPAAKVITIKVSPAVAQRKSVDGNVNLAAFPVSSHNDGVAAMDDMLADLPGASDELKKHLLRYE